MATIDILCVIDTNFLVKQSTNPGTQNNPTSLGSWTDSDTFVFMISDGQFAANNQGKSELTVKASVGDTLRWTITDPSTGLITGQDSHSYSCILYQFSSSSSQGIITTPALTTAPAIAYCNNSQNEPSAYAYMCSSWTSSVLTTGNVQYVWAFQIIDCADGSVVGYYTWDPFINIVAPVTSTIATEAKNSSISQN